MYLFLCWSEDVKPTRKLLGKWKIVEGRYEKYKAKSPQGWELDHAETIDGEVVFLSMNNRKGRVKVQCPRKTDSENYPLVG
jgi:hypothetical protein